MSECAGSSSLPIAGICPPHPNVGVDDPTSSSPGTSRGAHEQLNQCVIAGHSRSIEPERSALPTSSDCGLTGPPS